MILGFDGSRDQNVFVAQKGLEPKVDTILRRISQMQKISCSGSQLPTVRVSVVASGAALPPGAASLLDPGLCPSWGMSCKWTRRVSSSLSRR